MYTSRIANQIKFGVLALSIAALFTGCSEHEEHHHHEHEADAHDHDDSDLHPDWPTYIVGGEANYPPFTLRDEHGHVIGYDIDLLNAIGKEQHFHIKFVPSEWSSNIFGLLDTEDRDIIATGTYYTPERAEKWAASIPVLTSYDEFLVKGESDIHSPANLFGKVIAVEGGTLQEEFINDYYAGTAKQVELYPSIYSAFESLLRGASNAVYSDSKILDYYIHSMPKDFYDGTFRFIPTANQREMEYVFYVKKSNQDLLKSLDNGIRKLKANGEFDKINEKWFGKGE